MKKAKLKYIKPELHYSDSPLSCYCSSGSGANTAAAQFPICQNGNNVDGLAPQTECDNGNNPTWQGRASCKSGNHDTGQASYCKNGTANQGYSFTNCQTGNGVA